MIVKLVELSADERTKGLYERCEKERRDERSRIRGVKFDIAKNLFLTNLTVDEIAKATGLSYEEVENLQKRDS